MLTTRSLLTPLVAIGAVAIMGGCAVEHMGLLPAPEEPPPIVEQVDDSSRWSAASREHGPYIPDPDPSTEAPRLAAPPEDRDSAAHKTYQLTSHVAFQGDLLDTPLAAEWAEKPAQLLVDLMMRQTCDWAHAWGDLSKLQTEDFRSWPGVRAIFPEACGIWSEIAAPVREALEKRIAAHGAKHGKSFFAGWGEVVDYLSAGTLHSELRLDPPDASGNLTFEHELRTWTVPLARGSIRYDVTLGLRPDDWPRTVARGVATLDGETLQLPDHTFEAYPAYMLQDLVNEFLLPAFGADSVEALLADIIDCDAIEKEMLREPTWFMPSPEGRSSCEGGLELAAELLRNPFGESADELTHVTLSGAAAFDGEAARLVAGEWDGHWTCGPKSAAITGTFHGNRLADEPATRPH